MKLLFALMTFVLVQTAYANVGVVLIDMQKGFFDIEKTRNTKEVKQLLSKQESLIKWAREKKAPVVVFEYAGKGKTDSLLMKALAGMDVKVLIKKTDDGFAEMSKESRDAAHAFFTSKKVKTLVVSGINGGSCVMETIQGAGVLGYLVKTSPDLVGDLWSNPPLYPDDTWVYNHPKLKVFKNLSDVLSNL